MHADSASRTLVTAWCYMLHVIMIQCCHALQCNRHLFRHGISSLYCSSSPKGLACQCLQNKLLAETILTVQSIVKHLKPCHMVKGSSEAAVQERMT